MQTFLLLLSDEASWPRRKVRRRYGSAAASARLSLTPYESASGYGYFAGKYDGRADYRFELDSRALTANPGDRKCQADCIKGPSKTLAAASSTALCRWDM
ncbi:hypothetical protein GCM10027402_27350 [Arthrobacter monumenti]